MELLNVANVGRQGVGKSVVGQFDGNWKANVADPRSYLVGK